MEKSNDLVTQLQHGDYERIAEITGYCKAHVRKVIHGLRSNPKIVEATQKYITLREELKKEYTN